VSGKGRFGRALGLLLLPGVAACADAAGSPPDGGAEPDEPCDLGDTTAPGAAPTLLPAGAEGAFLQRAAGISALRPRCAAAWHTGAGAHDSTLRLELLDWDSPSPARLLATNVRAEVLADSSDLSLGSQVLIPIEESGEFQVWIEPVAEETDAAANPYTLRLSCESGCDQEYTRYPIVLMHGSGGTDAYVGLIDYFYGVKDALQARGYAVFSPAVEPFADWETRGAEWQAELQTLLDAGAGRKLNLLGHSQGGTDARYLASPAGLAMASSIASITTVASPHGGTPVADAVNGLMDSTDLEDALVDAAADALGALLGMGEQEAAEAVASFTTESMAAFNEAFPDDPAIPYFSWAGHSCRSLDADCRAAWNDEVVDPYFLPTFLLISAVAGDNDGMVPVESSRWGEFLGQLPADHADEIGQIADTDNAAFDHRSFYLEEARRLAAAGY
jgi:triacylglycerol esterase/lipase EstA (alpha/beta hydrolase family)